MSENRINWYPGHMAKARRQLEEQLKRLSMVDGKLPDEKDDEFPENEEISQTVTETENEPQMEEKE